jgi:CheY-like chemotaxis protein
LELVCRIPPGVPAWFVGDAAQLLGCIALLVENAIRATPQGEIVVDVRLPPKDATPSPFDAAWTPGQPPPRAAGGISPSLIVTLSAASRHRASPDPTDWDTSVKQVVAALGGELMVQYEPALQRVWTLHLALEPASNGCTPGHAVPPGVAGSSVLIADDSAPVRSTLDELLSACGARVRAAESGESALSAIRQSHAKDRPFDALIVDARMPRMSGFELAGHLVKNPGLCGPVLLLLPAPFRRGDENACRRLGVTARISKPVRRAELLPALAAALAGRRPATNGRRDIVSPSKRVDHAAGKIPAFDENAALRTLDGDRELLRNLAGMFLDDCSRLLTLCQDAMTARDASRLLRALNEARVAIAPFAAAPIVEAVDRLRDIAGRGQWEAAVPTFSEVQCELARLRTAVRSNGRTL